MRNKDIRTFGIYLLICLCTLFCCTSVCAKNKRVKITERMTQNHCIGTQVSDVKKLFKKAGFINLVLEKHSTENTSVDGNVLGITIDGSSDFSAGDRFDAETEVVITYWRAKKIIFEDGKNEYSTGVYPFIREEHLTKYFPNLMGINIYMVVSVDGFGSDYISSSCGEVFTSIKFHVGDNRKRYESLIQEDETIAILGTVGGIDDYGFLGKYLNIQNCLVIEKGSAAFTYQREDSDSYLYQFFYLSEEVANQLGEDLPEADFKSLCQTYVYEDILRNPDTYKKKYCVISGSVDQIIEGWFSGNDIYILDYQGNKWKCSYSYKEGEAHLLEGDYVTVYGLLDGTSNSTTLLGRQVTLPEVDLRYIR